MTYFWFLAKIKDGKPQIGEPDTFESFEFIPLDMLEKYNLSPNMQNLLAELKNNPTFLD